jgi:hypothetical protein
MFWLNAGHSTASILMVHLQKYQFQPNEIVGYSPTSSRSLNAFLCQAPSGQYGEGLNRKFQEMYVLVECRPFYRINFDGSSSEISVTAQRNRRLLANQQSKLEYVLIPSSVESIWRRLKPDISGDVFFGRIPAIALSNSRSSLSLGFGPLGVDPTIL